MVIPIGVSYATDPERAADFGADDFGARL